MKANLKYGKLELPKIHILDDFNGSIHSYILTHFKYVWIEDWR